MAQSEKDFQATVVQLAKLRGWLVYHTFDSRRSTAGFPDLVMVRKGRILFAELKTEAGKLSADQARWLEALREGEESGNAEVYLWRPSSWRAIEEALR